MIHTVNESIKPWLTALAGTALMPASAGAQATTSALRASVHSYAAAHDVEIVHELSDFLAIPNLATQRTSSGMQRASSR